MVVGGLGRGEERRTMFRGVLWFGLVGEEEVEMKNGFERDGGLK